MELSQRLAIYNMCKTTMRKTSWDKTGEFYLSDSDLEVYDIDSLKDKYYEQHQLPTGEKVSSCDALYIDEQTMYLIEFKNMTFENVMKGRIRGEVKEKLSASLLILTDILEIGISKTRENTNFILIYNDAKGRFAAELSRRVAPENNADKLKKYENIYYKQCLTLDSEEFQKSFVDEWELDEKRKKTEGVSS